MSDVHDTSPDTPPASVPPTPGDLVGTGTEVSGTEVSGAEVSGPVIDLADRPALMSFLRDVVLQTEGVWRLEPTIAGTLASFAPSVTDVRTEGASALALRQFDGISVQRTGARLDVSVDLATLWEFPAVEVARVVQRRLHGALLEVGVSPGVVDVSVLAIGND